MRDRDKIAVDVLRGAIKMDRDARVLGNVTAAELAAIVAPIVDTCPKCGATAWVDIDCELCNALSALLREPDREAAPGRS